MYHLRDWFIRGNLIISLRMTAAKCRLNIRGSYTEVPMCSAEVGHSSQCLYNGNRHKDDIYDYFPLDYMYFSQSTYGEYRWYE